MRTAPCAALLIVLAVVSVRAAGEDRLAPRAARSVHLGWLAPEVEAFYMEVVVERSTPGSYFMACGFHHGYFGIQELADGKKVVLFSVWDPTRGDDPRAVPQEERVEVLYNADDVRVRRFGGEGTGAQSFFDYQWQIGRPCRLFVEAVVNDGKTVYTAWFYLSESQSWKRLATFRTAASGDRLRGLYSFIEDFRRDGASALEMRRATFASGWVRDAAGKWSPLSRARFSASGAEWEAKETIDAGFAGEQLYLQTGGQTQTSNPLGATLTRPAGTAQPPAVPGGEGGAP